jgi:hypothetical protein
LTLRAAARSVDVSPKGPSDANGGDHLNAHASSRFLRATDSPRSSPAHRHGHARDAGYHRAVIPVFLVVVGVGLLVAGWLLMRRLGPAARVGRILAATPDVPLSTARALAAGGRPRYVGVAGRIDAEGEFEDEHHRPLVFRRSRLELRGPRGWSMLEDDRRTVPFEVVEGLDRLAIAGDELDAGLVVIVREAEGTAGEVPDRVPAETPPSTPVRLRVEQVSSVDHVIALGVPYEDAERGPTLGPGLGRPLILTNLERAEAMRVLAVDRRSTTQAAAIALAFGLLTVAGGLAWMAVDALA